MIWLRMPHLLVAGSTGSPGKSVAVNGIIQYLDDQVYDESIKRLELSVYNDIPHLLIPVVTNPRRLVEPLQKGR